MKNKKWNKYEGSLGFYNKGCQCLKAGQIIFEKMGSPHEILLIHGVELLLKSFILIRDPKIKTVLDIRGHNIINLYNKCKKLDQDLFKSWILKEYLYSIPKYFYKDSVEARYPEEDKTFKIYSDIYDRLNIELVYLLKNIICPLQKI